MQRSWDDTRAHALLSDVENSVVGAPPRFPPMSVLGAVGYAVKRPSEAAIPTEIGLCLVGVAGMSHVDNVPECDVACRMRGF